MKEVRIFDLSFDKEFRQRFHEGCEKIFDEAYLTDHTFVRRFEKKFAEYCGVKHTLAVSSGTAAIELALRALNVRGKKVLIPTNTFIATAVAVLNAGATPIFLDIENDYFAIDPSDLVKKINNDVAAVVVVHIGGHVSTHFDLILKICQERNIPIVEDAAHAHGATFKGIKAGALGDVGAFSHFMTKIMTTGEGGSLTCTNDEFYNRAYSSRRFGFDPENSISHLREGTNFKMSEFQALLGVLELERLEKRIAKRRALAERYQKNLKGTPWICISDSKESKGSYYKQIVLSPIKREKVDQHLRKNHIALTGGVFFIPLHRQPVYKNLVDDKCFPNANHFTENHICPPCYPELDFESIDHVCECLLELARA